MFKEILLLN